MYTYKVVPQNSDNVAKIATFQTACPNVFSEYRQGILAKKSEGIHAGNFNYRTNYYFLFMILDAEKAGFDSVAFSGTISFTNEIDLMNEFQNLVEL